MSKHGPEELAREGRRIRAQTRASLMSDTKWRKMFAALEGQPNLTLNQCLVKFVDVPEAQVMSPNVWTYPSWPWVDTFEFGPIPLRSIEWLLFPRIAEHRVSDRTITPKRIAQDVDAAADIIASLGQYPMELSERGLLIMGYLPS